MGHKRGEQIVKMAVHNTCLITHTLQQINARIYAYANQYAVGRTTCGEA